MLRQIIRQYNEKQPVMRGYSRMAKHDLAILILKYLAYDVSTNTFGVKRVATLSRAPKRAKRGRLNPVLDDDDEVGAPRVLATRRKAKTGAAPRSLPVRRKKRPPSPQTPSAKPLQGTLSKGMQSYKNALEDIAAKWQQRALQGFDTGEGGFAFK